MKSLLKIPLMIFICIVSGVGLLLSISVLVVLSVPNVATLKGCMTTSMFEVKVCPGTANYVPLSRIADNLVDALVVSEDAAFFSHSGFDWFELQASLEKNLSTQEYSRGGSTLTQQLAKNAFLSADKSVWRKLREAYLTHQLEAKFTKQEILEKYLNMVEFGKDIYGVKKAAQHYFGKAPQNLHVLESAFLVMLLPNPKKYSQSYRDGRLTPFAQKMIKIILKRMVQYRKISTASYSFAIDNLGSFPWRHLSQSDFNFSLPTLPESATGNFETPEQPMDEEAVQQEIEQNVTEALDSDTSPEETDSVEEDTPPDPEEEIR